MDCKIDIYEYRDYLRQRYGETLHRLPIDTGGNCPHRDTGGHGGCIFCPEDGARAVQLGKTEGIRQQITAGVTFAQRRYKASAFMAYLQTYTSTFASLETIQQQVDIILETKGIKAIAFGTRPDCLAPHIIDYLKGLNKHIDIWIELGVQTCHDQTLLRINRGHDWQSSKEAIIKIKKAGLSTAVHLILGLPTESAVQMRQTIDSVCSLPIDALKLHNLHVIKNTRLAEEYHRHKFPLYSEHEYSDLLLELLPHIPKHIPLIRLTTDTDHDQLIAPHWTMSKGQFRQHLSKQMKARGIAQGCALGAPSAPAKTTQAQNTSTVPVTTGDGSVTFFNRASKEHYHPLTGAKSATNCNYIIPANLENRLQKGTVQLLDICFGLGYNSLLACELAMRGGKKLEITALEMDSTVVERAALALQGNGGAFDWHECLTTLHRTGCWQKEGCRIEIIWGDARHTAKKCTSTFDLIFLDAFTPQRNSELWTLDFFNILHPLVPAEGALITSCTATPVRAGFLLAGFFLGETAPAGRERGGTICTTTQTLIERPLPERERFLMATRRGVPYRDPSGTRTNKEILRTREFEITQKKTGVFRPPGQADDKDQCLGDVQDKKTT